MQKPDLSRVTLVTVDTVCHELTRLALDTCTAAVDYGAVLVLSDKKIGDYGWVTFNGTSPKDVSDAYYKTLPFLVQTDYMMIVHWDSWIINPSHWRDAFLAFDYIGAPWWHNVHNVGNSGFSIRSIKMARYIAESTLEHDFPDDDVICRRHRPALEAAGFRFAPSELAGYFAFERNILYPIDRVFGFHGMFNWPHVLTDQELDKRVALAPPYVLKNIHFAQMLDVLNKLRRPLPIPPSIACRAEAQ